MKSRPVLAGYVIIARTFFRGSRKKTDRTVSVSLAFGWIMPYSEATFRSGSPMIGKFIVVRCVSSMSPIQPLCDFTSSTLTAMTLQFRFSNSAFVFATKPSSVVQTGVKSFGCDIRTHHLSPTHSWKLTLPSVVSAVKSGAMSPS